MSPQIDNNDIPGTCCDAHVLGDGSQCACVSPQINDPEHNGECCDPDSTNPSICAMSKLYSQKWKKNPKCELMIIILSP